MNIHWSGALENSATGKAKSKLNRLNVSAIFKYSEVPDRSGDGVFERHVWNDVVHLNRTAKNASVGQVYYHADKYSVKKARVPTMDLWNPRTIHQQASTTVVVITCAFFCITLALTVTLGFLCRKRNSVFALTKTEPEDCELDGTVELSQDGYETETELDLERGGIMCAYNHHCRLTSPDSTRLVQGHGGTLTYCFEARLRYDNQVPSSPYTNYYGAPNMADHVTWECDDDSSTSGDKSSVAPDMLETSSSCRTLELAYT